MAQEHTSRMSLAERVLGVADPNDSEALSQAHFALTGEREPSTVLALEADILDAELTRLSASRADRDAHTIDVETLEQSVSLNALVSIFKKQKLSYFTFLRSWPLYEDLYTRHVQPGNEPEDARALLIGSMSALSSAAFAAFSEDVLHARPTITDPRSSAAKRRHGTFVEANGLDLPRDWAGTMKTVATNHLTPMLLDTRGQPITGLRAETTAMRTLFDQVLQALQGGGSLLMVETPPRFDGQDIDCETQHNRELVAEFADTVRTLLGEVGFTGVAIDEGWELEDVRYLFDPEREFSRYPRTPKPRIRTIYARKPGE